MSGRVTQRGGALGHVQRGAAPGHRHRHRDGHGHGHGHPKLRQTVTMVGVDPRRSARVRHGGAVGSKLSRLTTRYRRTGTVDLRCDLAVAGWTPATLGDRLNVSVGGRGGRVSWCGRDDRRAASFHTWGRGPSPGTSGQPSTPFRHPRSRCTKVLSCSRFLSYPRETITGSPTTMRLKNPTRVDRKFPEPPRIRLGNVGVISHN